MRTIPETIEELLKKACVDLIEQNSETLGEKILIAEDGELPFSISLKMTKTEERIYVEAKGSFAQKFISEASFSEEIENEMQPKLDITIDDAPKRRKRGDE